MFSSEFSYLNISSCATATKFLCFFVFTASVLTALSTVRRLSCRRGCLKRGETPAVAPWPAPAAPLANPGGRNGFYQDGVQDEESFSLICNIQEVNRAAFRFNVTPPPPLHRHHPIWITFRRFTQGPQEVVKPHRNIMQLRPFGGVWALLESTALQVLFF